MHYRRSKAHKRDAASPPMRDDWVVKEELDFRGAKGKVCEEMGSEIPESVQRDIDARNFE